MSPWRMHWPASAWTVGVVACVLGLLPTLTTAQVERPPAPLVHVTLQLQWVTQAQFAGYYAAVDQGF